MVDNMVVPVTANLPASVTPSSGGVAGGAGQDSSQAANFTDILQTVISTLGPGLGNIQGGTIVNADGKTISLDDLIQQLLNGGSDIKTDPGKKTDSANGINDLLQQMVTQLQASITQPTVVVPSGQTNSSGVELTALNDNLTNNTAGQDLNAINAAMMSAGAVLAGIAQQAPANNTASQAPDNMNSAVSGPEGAALTVSDLSAAMQNSSNLAQNAVNAAMPNTGSAMQNAAGAPALNAASSAQSAVNAAMPNAASSTQSTVNAAMPNAASSAQSAVNAAMPNGGGSTQNTGNTAALNVASSAQSAVNAAVPNGGSQTQDDSLDGNLNFSGLRITTVNESKSGSEDAGPNTVFSAVPLHQTSYTEDAKPAQETLPVSRLNELSGPILKTLGSGDSNLVIKLSPPDMGTIQIKLKMENGVLTADFKVDSSAVKDLFTSAMPQIRQSIESSGIKTGNFFANLKEDSYRDGRRQQDQNQQQQRQNKEQKSSFFDFFA